MSELLADGLPFTMSDEVISKRLLQVAVRDGDVRRVFRGVYVDRRAPDTRELRVVALERVRPRDGVACSETAAWIMGVDVHQPGRRHDFTPHFLVPHGTSRLTLPGVHCRQAKLSHRETTTDFGSPTTTPVRTASDLLRRQYRPYALASADQMARVGLVDLGELSELVHRLKGFPGIRQARSLVTLIDPRSETPGESWSRLRIHDAGLPAPDLQVVVVDRDGTEWRLDMAYVLRLIAAEFDGREHHTSPRDVAHDLWRRDILSDQLGWRFAVARRESIFGPDDSFERQLGEWLGVPILRRWWGTR